MRNLFDNISPKNKEKLLKTLEAYTYNFPKNTMVLKSIKGDNILGIVDDGLVQIIRNDYDGDRTIIDEINKDEIFGSMIYPLENSEYDILTKNDTTIIIIDYDNILNKSVSNNYAYITFVQNLLQILSDKINQKNERIEILTKKTIRNKLLEYFKIVSKKQGYKTINLSFNYTELADYLSVDRSAMSRELKNLKDEGFISIKNKKITLLY